MSGEGLRPWSRRARAGALIGVAAGLLAAASANLPLVETWERRTLDMRVRGFADSRQADPAIVAVVIDQKSLDAISASREQGGLDQSWPWPRDYYAVVLRYLLEAGVRAVAFDLVFSEPSLHSRLGVVDDDAELARVAMGRPVVQAAVFAREALLGQGRQPDRTWPAGMLNQPYTRGVDGAGAEPFNRAILPVDPLLRSTRGLGWIGLEPDSDGRCRSIRPAAVYAPTGSHDALEIWSIPLALVAVLGRSIEVLPGRPAAARLVVDGRVMPIDEDGRLLLRFHGGEGTYRQFSFARVLESAKRVAEGLPTSAARPQDFQDKVVLIGATAAGLADQRATSVGAVLPGYLIHATALDNVLHGDAIRRPPRTVRMPVLLALGAVCGVLVGVSRPFRGGVLAVLGPGVLYVAGALWQFQARGVWLDLVPPGLALVFAWAGASGYAYFTREAEPSSRSRQVR